MDDNYPDLVQMHINMFTESDIFTNSWNKPSKASKILQAMDSISTLKLAEPTEKLFRKDVDQDEL